MSNSLDKMFQRIHSRSTSGQAKSVFEFDEYEKSEGVVQEWCTEVCQKCHDEFRKIFSFLHQCIESTKTLCKLTEVTVQLKKPKTFSLMAQVKSEIEQISEDFHKNADTLEYHSMHETSKCLAPTKKEHKGINAFQNYNSGSSFISQSDLTDCYIEGIKIESCNGREVSENNVDWQRIKKSIVATDEKWIMDDYDTFEAEEKILNEEIGIMDESETLKSKVGAVSFVTNEPIMNVNIIHKKIANDLDPKMQTNCTTADQSNFKRKKTQNVKHGRKPMKCNQCDAKYMNQNAFRAHKQTHDGKIFECDKCDHQFPGKLYLQIHKGAYHSGKTFNCDVCAAKFSSTNALRNHKLTHAGLIYKCEQCSVKLNSRSSFFRHQRSHTFESHNKRLPYKRKKHSPVNKSDSYKGNENLRRIKMGTKETDEKSITDGCDEFQALDFAKDECDFDETVDHTLKTCSTGKDKQCENSANSFLFAAIVKEECDISFEGTITDAVDASSA